MLAANAATQTAGSTRDDTLSTRVISRAVLLHEKNGIDGGIVPVVRCTSGCKIAVGIVNSRAPVCEETQHCTPILLTGSQRGCGQGRLWLIVPEVGAQWGGEEEREGAGGGWTVEDA